MAGKASFSAEEWQQVAKLPMLVAEYVGKASKGGPIGTIKEMWAVVSSLKGEAESAEGLQIIKDLMADMEEQKPAPSGEGASAPKSNDAILSELGSGLALVDSKAPGEASAFRQWLYQAAVKVAEANKEGGFLGIGGTPVSAEEQSALADLARVLNVTA